MKQLLKLSFLVLALVVGGCIVPAPDRVTHGDQLNKESLKFMDSPENTRADVLTNLGEPLVELRDAHLMVYEWEQMVRAFVIPAKEIHANPDRVCLFVEFDANEKVSRHAIRKIGLADPATAALEWKHGRQQW